MIIFMPGIVFKSTKSGSLLNRPVLLTLPGSYSVVHVQKLVITSVTSLFFRREFKNLKTHERI